MARKIFGMLSLVLVLAVALSAVSPGIRTAQWQG